jgi:DNA repair exonuclease SbcCD nuclease subunit
MVQKLSNNTPNKIVVWTDLHFGLRGNERRHNQECEEFIKWMIQEAHEFGAETSIFSGDWHHYRSSVQTSTLNYSVSAFELLGKNFKNHYQIVGNHDLFYKDKREINSVEFAREVPNIHIISEISQVGDLLLCPWLVDNEYKKVSQSTNPFIFGHFEFPSFYMNALVAMPDHGKIHSDQFRVKDQWVFSGHFHKRQIRKNQFGANIAYIGNCFPHSYSDAGDDQRGIMLLELGKEPIFKKWPHAPKFRHLELSEVLLDPSFYLDSYTNAKIQIDVDLNYEESKFIKETFHSQFRPREIKFIPRKNDSDMDDFEFDDNFENVDQIVIEQLKSIPDGQIDKNLLIDIYQNLE